jgi:hypothetical protein
MGITMNKLLLIGLFVLLMPMVFAADSCRVDDTCTWYAAGNGGTVNVSLTIYDSEGNILYNEVNMTPIGGYIYKLDTNITVEGQVVGKSFFYNSTGLQGTSEESKNIYQENAEVEFNMIAEILQPFLIFLIGALIFFLGTVTKEKDGYVYNIFSGIWWLGSAAYMIYTGTWITSIFFILLGFVTIMTGISKLGE